MSKSTHDRTMCLTEWSKLWFQFRKRIVELALASAAMSCSMLTRGLRLRWVFAGWVWLRGKWASKFYMVPQDLSVTFGSTHGFGSNWKEKKYLQNDETYQGWTMTFLLLCHWILYKFYPPSLAATKSYALYKNP